MSAAPPPTTEQWLSAPIPRVLALRMAQGALRLIAAVLGTAAVVLLLDAGLPLSAWVRGLFLSVWLTTVGVLTWCWVLVPWRGEMPLAEVLYEVGKRYPALAGRLRDAIGDTASARAAHRGGRRAKSDPSSRRSDPNEVGRGGRRGGRTRGARGRRDGHTRTRYRRAL